MATSNKASAPQEQLTSDRPDAASIQKWKSMLQQIGGQVQNLAAATPNFKPSYVTEVMNKLNEGVEYTKLLAKQSLEDAKDITKTPESGRAPPVVLTVDTTSDLAAMIKLVLACHRNNPLNLNLFLDTEGDQLGGGTNLLQLFLDSCNTVYIIDVLTLKDSTFTTPTSNGVTFKDVLEDPYIRKAFYDVTGDSNDLWKSYGVHLKGIDDLNLYAIACYGGTAKEKGRGLAMCVSQNTKRDLSDDERKKWAEIKDWGKKMFKETSSRIAAAENGEIEDWTPVFNQRPIRSDVLEYAVQDVTVLPIVFRHCMVRLKEMKDGKGDLWMDRIAVETNKRILESQSSSYQEAYDAKADHGVIAWKGAK